MLVACGANVNIQCKYAQYNNPLQAACYNPNGHRRGYEDGSTVYIDIARFLLKHGADPNLHGGHGGDALQAAVAGSGQGSTEGNNIDIVKLMIEHGAQLNHRGGSFHSAMRAAVYGGNMAAAHLLIDLGAELDDEVFLEAVDGERASVIPRLLENGVDVNAENKRGTALQLAIKYEDWATVRYGYSPLVNFIHADPRYLLFLALCFATLTLMSTQSARAASASRRYTSPSE